MYRADTMHRVDEAAAHRQAGRRASKRGLAPPCAVRPPSTGRSAPVHAQAPDIVENTATLLSRADGLFMPRGIISRFPAVDPFTDRWVFLVAEDHDTIGAQLTLDGPGPAALGDLPVHPRRPGHLAAQHDRY